MVQKQPVQLSDTCRVLWCVGGGLIQKNASAISVLKCCIALCVIDTCSYMHHGQ